MTASKHFAFLLHYPSKDKCLLWPAYYEDAKKEIDKKFEEVQFDISGIVGFHAFLEREQPYKVFVKRVKVKI